MVTICILIGFGLVACGIIIAYITKKGRKEKPSPPPLPPRVNVGIPSPTVSHARTRTRSSSAAARTLPPRRSSASAIATDGAGNGPRGIKPAQFPCCPFDKQRNVPGERQVIFWDRGENCYRCSRGHRFKSNGKPRKER